MKRKLKRTVALALALSSSASSLPIMASETPNYEIEDISEDDDLSETETEVEMESDLSEVETEDDSDLSEEIEDTEVNEDTEIIDELETESQETEYEYTERDIEELKVKLQNILQEKSLGVTYEEVLSLIGEQENTEAFQSIVETLEHFNYSLEDYGYLTLGVSTPFTIQGYIDAILNGGPSAICDIRLSKARTTIALNEANFPDAKLRVALATALNILEGEAFDPTQTISFGTGSSSAFYSQGITNIAGLQYFTNLQTLSLTHNDITDLTPLQNLTSLTYLALGGNGNLEDLTPLRNLLRLGTLYIWSCNIFNLQPLQNLTSLTTLQMEGNTNIDKNTYKYLPQASMYLLSNPGDDLSVLAPQLVYYTSSSRTTKRTSWTTTSSYISSYTSPAPITLTDTFFPDANLRAAISSQLGINEGEAFDPTEYTTLGTGSATSSDLFYNRGIASLEGLQYFTNLECLYLIKNNITSLQPLQNLTNLTTLYIYGNPIDPTTYKYLPQATMKLYSNANVNLTELAPQLAYYTDSSRTTLRTSWEKTGTGGNSGIDNVLSYTSPITPISISDVTFEDKVYDGTTNIDVTSVTFNGAALTKDKDYTVTAKLDSVNAGTRTATVTVTITNPLYNLTTSTFTKQVTVAKRPLTISNATVSNKTYDGNTTASVTAVTFSNLASGESLTLDTDFTVSGTFNDKNAGSNKSVSVNVTLGSSTKASNYTLSSTSYTKTGVTISKAKIVMSADNWESKHYDGTNTAILISAEVGGVIDGEELILNRDFTITNGKFKGTDVGSYNVSYTATLLNTDLANNYSFSYSSWTSGSTFDITPAPLTITSVSADSKVYDESDTATITNVELKGLVNNETLVLGTDFTVTGTFNDSNVGTNKDVTANVTLTSTRAKNYELTADSQTTTKASITPSSSLISHSDITNQDGITTSEFTFEDTLKVSVTPNLSSARTVEQNTLDLYINDEKVGTATVTQGQTANFEVDLNTLNLGPNTYQVTAVWNGNDNVDGTRQALGTIKISPIVLAPTITEQVVYTGSNIFNFNLDSSVLPSGITGTTTVTLSSANVNEYTEFTSTTTELQGDKSNHYIVEDVKGTVNITPKSVSLALEDINLQTSKVYDGTDTVKINSASLKGLVENEVAEYGVDFELTATHSTSNVGQTTITITPTAKNTDLMANYTLITTELTTTGEITKGETQITGQHLGTETEATTEFTFDEELVIYFTPTVRTTLSNQATLYIGDLEVQTVDAYENNTVEFRVNLNELDLTPSDYEIKVVYGGGDNLNGATFTLDTITLNQIDITATYNTSKVYDGSNIITVDLDELPSGLKGTATLELTSADAGTYVNQKVTNISLTGNENNHYNLTFESVTGTVGITQKELTIQDVELEDKVYDSLNDIEVKNVTFNGLVGNETLTLNTDYTATATLDDENVGSQDVIVTVVLNTNNYILQNSKFNTSATIEKGESNLTTSALKGSYTFAETLELEVTPNLNARTVENTASLFIGDTLVQTINVQQGSTGKFSVLLNDLAISQGTYEVKVVWGGNSNLNSTEQSLGTIQISNIQISPTFEHKEVYNGSTTFDVTLDNLPDNLTGTATVTIASPDVDVYTDFRDINVSLQGNNLSHYDIVSCLGALTIEKANHSNQTTSLAVSNGLEKTYTVDLTPYLDVKDPVLSVKEVQSNSYVTITPTVQSNALIVKVNEVDTTVEGTVTTLEVVISSKNHSDFSVFVEVQASNREIPTITVGDTSIVWGEDLTIEDLIYKADVDGTLTFSQDIDSLPAGTHIIEVTFTPTDLDTYSPITIPIKVEVAQKEFTTEEVEIEVELPKVNQGTTLGDVELPSLEIRDENGDILTDYVFEWVTPNEEIKIGQSYDYVIKSDNFTYTGSIVVYPIPNEVPETTTSPTVPSDLIQGTKLEDITFDSLGQFKDEYGNPLTDYTIEWVNPSQEVVAGQSYEYIIKGDGFEFIGSITLIPEVPSVPQIDEEPTISANTEISQGTKLEEVTFDGLGTFTDSNGNIITDYVIEWVNPSQEIIAGQSYNYIIKGDNFVYIGSIILIPTIPTISRVEEAPTVSSATALRQGTRLAEVTFDGLGEFKDESGNTLSGYTIEWVDPSQEIVVGQAYEYIIRGDNYVYVGSIVLIPELPTTPSTSLSGGGSASISILKPTTTDLDDTLVDSQEDSQEDTQDDTQVGSQVDTQTNNQVVIQTESKTQHWASEKVQVLVELDVLDTAPTNEELNTTINKGEFASLLHQVLKAYGVEFGETSNTYTDLYGEHMGALLDLTSLGIFAGNGDGTITAEKTITREEVASVLTGVVRVLGLATTKQIVIYEDDAVISSWAKEKVAIATQSGLMVGYTDGTFKPQNNITYAEAITIMHNIIQEVEN